LDSLGSISIDSVSASCLVAVVTPSSPGVKLIFGAEILGL
jgi:hypothetical protein